MTRGEVNDSKYSGSGELSSLGDDEEFVANISVDEKGSAGYELRG